MPFSLFSDTYTRAFQYKFLNNILVNRYWLHKWKIEKDDKCIWCNKYSDTLIHSFWECEHIKVFWTKIKLLCLHQNINITITKNLILIGDKSQKNVINIMVILAKQFIQRVKVKGAKLHESGFIAF